jgi:acetolactate synthase-1/2/3 large subunit
MKMNGAELLLKCIEKEGVDTIFGYPGGSVLPIYDALYASSIRHVLVRHEQGAAHAADGYARVTGKVGVCLATSGPGATNLVTGIATAYMDSVPMVAFTGQVGTALLGRDAFQEADITGITLPICKHNYLLDRAADIPRVVKEAFYIASTNRPGPVLIDLPKNLMEQEVDVDLSRDIEIKLRGYRVLKDINAGQIINVAEAIKQAKKPVIYAGGGVISSGASAELLQLAERMQIPVTTTLMGLSAIPSRHPLSLGMLGMHGSRYANYAIAECDLLLAAGVRFDDRVTGKIDQFASHARIVHIDIDAAEIGKNVNAHIPVVGDLKIALQALLARLPESKDPEEWQDKILRWKAEYPLRYPASKTERIMPQMVVERISALTGGQAIICTEVGQNQMWAAQFYQFAQPRSFVSSGGLGTMGFGLPAAIGAAMAEPGVPIFDIAGDGSIQMNIQEMATAVQYKLPVIICILNNHFLGMVRQWQHLFYGGRYSYTDMSHQPDFVKLAEAYGAKGIRVTKEAEVDQALLTALEVKDGPVIIDFVVDREADVYPMVPPGAAILNMLGGD